MTVPIRFLVIISVLIAVIAVAMVPRSNEWLAVLRDEDKQAQVIALLEPRLAHGENDPAILAALGQAYAAVGDDWTGGRADGALHRCSGRAMPQHTGCSLTSIRSQHAILPEQIAMLQRSIAYQPPAFAGRRTCRHIPSGSAADDELALLSSFQAQLTLESGLVLRLAQLRADSGDRQGADQALLRDDVTSVAKPAEQPERADVAGRDAGRNRTWY